MVKSRFQNDTSGNSSGVEHNLAKVGVASSNLVSRSIFILITIFIIFSHNLFALTLAESLKIKIKEDIPNATINSISIEKPSSLPQDFSSYKLKDIFILSIRSNDGNFRALYEMPNKLNKSIFFKFKIDANVNVLVAIKDIDRDHILNLSDYEQKSVSLKEYDKEALKEAPKNIKLITRTRIKRGKILTNRQFKTLSDIKKGDLINAVLKDGALNIEVLVTALEDGNVGDIIQVRNENNQVFKANVISKNRVLIR